MAGRTGVPGPSLTATESRVLLPGGQRPPMLIVTPRTRGLVGVTEVGVVFIEAHTPEQSLAFAASGPIRRATRHERMILGGRQRR